MDMCHVVGRDGTGEINAEHLCTAGGGQAVNGQWH
jgi:hypothetical protein